MPQKGFIEMTNIQQTTGDLEVKMEMLMIHMMHTRGTNLSKDEFDEKVFPHLINNKSLKSAFTVALPSQVDPYIIGNTEKVSTLNPINVFQILHFCCVSL